MWVYYALLIAPIWVLLIWLLVFPALVMHLKTAYGLSDILLYITQFLFAPLTLVLIIALLILSKIAKFLLQLLEAVIAVALMLLLILVAPFVWLVERFNLKPGWLIEQWLKVGDLVLDVLHKLFSRAWGALSASLVANPRPISASDRLSSQPK